mmetsp:Transcript_11387/g.28041  ORF Transcript_11387/g.28041 Transcript_11387/m.28041 type:complete len:120 (-) Transcript_11387:40-399(-)
MPKKCSRTLIVQTQNDFRAKTTSEVHFIRSHALSLAIRFVLQTFARNNDFRLPASTEGDNFTEVGSSLRVDIISGTTLSRAGKKSRAGKNSKTSSANLKISNVSHICNVLHTLSFCTST